MRTFATPAALCSLPFCSSKEDRTCSILGSGCWHDPDLIAGFGQFGAVGFSYDVSADAAPAGSDESSSDDSDDEDLPKLGEEQIDGLAANLGIADFSFMLRRAERQEADFAAGNMKKPK